MEEIELTVMSRGPATAPALAPLLAQFEAQNSVAVHLRLMEWDTAWTDVLKIALYRHGADVSEIGTTWLGSLVGMDAVEPFLHYEIEAIERTSSFVPSTWQSGALPPHPQEPAVQWAIPWWADTRLLFYRRDLLEQAGIAQATAFQSFERLDQTLDRLCQAGVPLPLVIPTHQSRMTLHNMASWVWGTGGDLVSSDGRQILLHRPPGRQGLRAYLELARHLAPAARDLDDTESDRLFCDGSAAVTISGPWLAGFVAPEVRPHLDITLPPGTPFVGGSHLVCWRNTRQRPMAVKLIRFLTSREVQAAFSQEAGLLPTRLDVLSSPSFSGQPLYQVVSRGLQLGRPFPSHRLWGLVEDKLNEALGRVWNMILSQPDPDLEQILRDHLDPVAYQLEVALSSRR